MRKLPLLTAALAAAILALTGCGNDGDGSQSADQFNNADVIFAQEMIPHHKQAILMAQIAQERAASPDVKSLAADIEQAQDPEIQTMTDWLNAWGEEVPEDSSMPGVDHGGMSMDMPGMMSQEDIADMEAASGAAFDQMFLTMMIEHHEGAVEMAQTQQAEGENPYAIALADKIEADQTTEITTMQNLLDS